jgi:mono/diheme cytochrome c family protein
MSFLRLSALLWHSRRRMLLPMAVITVLLTGCYRGQPSDKPPVHPVSDMDDQPRYDPQSESQFFDDHSTMRQPVEGTVPRERPLQNDAYIRGLDSTGEFVVKNQESVTEEGLHRGRERYDIFCSACHGRVGDGRGIVVEKEYVAPPSFDDDRIMSMPDGQIFDVITNGSMVMPSYSHQIPVRDRWLIIQYIRALQRSQRATENEVPLSVIDSLRQRER